MNEHEKINYVEFPAKNLDATKTFFCSVFGWSFVDYGPEYTAFSNEGLNGGFYKSELTVSTENGSALIVFYSKELENTKAKIEKAGGSIIKPIFSFLLLLLGKVSVSVWMSWLLEPSQPRFV